MSLDLIRYYFYLEEDAEYIVDFQNRLQERGIYCQSSSGIQGQDSTDEQDRSCFLQLKNNKINILAVRLSGNDYPPADNEALLQELETAAMLNTDNLLGRVTVWAAYDEDYDQLKASLLKNKKAALQIKMINGVLTRQTLFWPRGHAQYLCMMTEMDEISEKFLAGGLPIIEASLLQLNLIDNLYRERHMAIEKQTQALDKRLSVILHTDLVSRQSQLKQVEDLESQLNELAKSYGITAGNKNVIIEGIRRIKPQITAIARQLEEEKALLPGPGLIDKILAPFNLRLDHLQNNSAALDISLQNHQAAIDVVESKVQIMNSRQNINTQEKIRDLLEINATLQKQSLIFQMSAAAIEFIVIAYYSHSLWKAMAVDAYHAVPGWIQLIFVLLFSGNVVYCTHLLGEYLQNKEDKQAKKDLLISVIPLALIFVIILLSSFLLG
ncbi:MAG: hypothetical protein GX581_02995 [Syntrophomonadaceae bacterium]|nr:hypothetical protein [Syntrophomonadaceae bacterium]